MKETCLSPAVGERSLIVSGAPSGVTIAEFETVLVFPLTLVDVIVNEYSIPLVRLEIVVCSAGALIWTVFKIPLSSL